MIEFLTLTAADLAVEREQLLDEGKDISSVETELAALAATDLESDPALQDRANALLDLTAALPMRPGYPYNEPSDLAGIHAQRPDGPRRFAHALADDVLFDRVHAAWLGRCAGCLLGKPVEGWRSYTMWPYLHDLGRYPLAGYFRSDVPDAVYAKYPKVLRGRAYVDLVSHMPEDDDTNYTVTGLAIMKKHGRDFTPADVGMFWLDNIPMNHTYTAERVAYRNLANLALHPRSATLRNPYREWIGAQIRADFFGYAAVGNPELAAEFAWRDATVSHIKNGIYGEMWVAAMLAAAPFVADVHELLIVGLSEIPRTCRLAADIHQVISWHSEGIGFDKAIERIHTRWDEDNPHHWCHTNSNAQIVALGLLWGEGSYALSICRAVQACFDTDCNGATVGSLFGMMHGTAALPDEWIAPLNDRLDTGIAGYHSVRISEIARQGFDIYKNIAP